jgi:mRNA interferase MazF
MENDFDRWNEVKKKVDNKVYSQDMNIAFPREGEVWMCILGKNIGLEQNGGGDNFARPVLVVKKFNNQIFWVIPLSSKQKNLDFYYNFRDIYYQNVSAVVAQMKLMSGKRFIRDMYVLPIEHFVNIKHMLLNFIEKIQIIETPH